VTSIGCGDSKDAIPESVYDSLKSALVRSGLSILPLKQERC
jgi:hypothetical protein